ncbi:hypothetical protein OsJ_08731 [Oryza sativa Japonica Group]|uniref:Uncharacterized protein n=1 Tax=Oryza sativa subsp. japonica TaxID=39947 RepID=B9F417_ORYSJ|nr:hypothetical protein OsJ_08731 [Oryza sativa Japonica Group]
MATAAVLGSHDALDNRMHLGAFAVSPASKPRRRRHSKAASPPPKVAAQGSPTKELPKQRLVMGEIRILKRGEEPPVSSPSPAPVAAQAAAVDQRAPPCSRLWRQAAPIDQKAPRPARSKQQQHTAAVPTKIKSVADAPVYAGPAFSSASPEPSSLPFPAFIRRAEAEATRGLRCLLRIGELP